MPDLRLLCLHGYHGTGATLRRQMAPLADALPVDIEFVYIDAPSLASGDFGWWHEGFSGWERTRDWITDQLSAGPRIDGLFGFSQGAALTGLLAALRESPGAPRGLDFGFAIMVGGFTSFLPQHADLFPRPLTIPSVHVIGRSDGVVPRPDSLKLAGRFADPLVLEHSGGHVIPGNRAVAEPIARFLTAMHSSYRDSRIQLLDIWHCDQARSFPAAGPDDAGQPDGVRPRAHGIQKTLGRTRQ